MHIRPVQPKISKDNPFEHEALNRKPSADILTSMLERAESPYVLAITGRFGKLTSEKIH